VNREDQKRDEEQCGEAGTSWPGGGSEPAFTQPCALPLGHDEGHDWEQHETAIWNEGYRAGRGETARHLRKLIEQFRDEYADGSALPRSDEWHTEEAVLYYLAADLLKLEALPYSDRPGYREEWRPQ
jgi:hypothetical protein